MVNLDERSRLQTAEFAGVLLFAHACRASCGNSSYLSQKKGIQILTIHSYLLLPNISKIDANTAFLNS